MAKHLPGNSFTKKVERRVSTDVDGLDVYHWPEFKALVEKLGIDWKLPSIQIVIDVEIGKPVQTMHKYLPDGQGHAG